MPILSYKSATLTDDEIESAPMESVYACFEGLGNNCEFGIVQRSVGFDPPGLFRNVGFLDIAQITRAIQENFEGMFDEGAYDFSLPNGWHDWQLECKKFGFGFHSTIPAELERSSAEWQSQADRVIKIFRYLKTKIRQDMKEGEKIFVFRTLQEIDKAAVQRLASALRLHGRSALFFVRPDRFEPVGTLRFEGQGLVIGSVDRLSNENPPVINFAAWKQMTRNILLSRDRIWASRQFSLNPQDHFAPIPAGGPAGAIAHRYDAQDGTNISVFQMELEGLREGSQLTVSVWIYVGGDFKPGDINLVFLGYSTRLFSKVDVGDAGRWQRIFSTCQLPPGAATAAPTLMVNALEPCVIFSAGWTFRQE